MAAEPGVVDVDHVREATQSKIDLCHGQGEGCAQRRHRASRLPARCRRSWQGTVGADPQRNGTQSAADRTGVAASIAAHQRRRSREVHVKGETGQLVSLAELGRWESSPADQMIYHKNLQRVAYVFAETAGRPPADVVVDLLADRAEAGHATADVTATWATAGWPARYSRPTWPGARFSPTAATSLGRAGRVSASPLPVRANGRSRWTCSATWDSPSPPR